MCRRIWNWIFRWKDDAFLPDQADLQAICSGRRRTCALLNSPLPCVDKAVEHIQELKVMVQNWCQQVNWCQKWPQWIKYRIDLNFVFCSGLWNIHRRITTNTNTTEF